MIRQDHPRKGTGVSKKYETTVSEGTVLAVPEQVSIAMEEVANGVREGCWPSPSAPSCR